MWKRAWGLDGVEYDSQREARVADWLLAHDIEYEPHKRLPRPSRQVSDFFLPNVGPSGLWVEFDGLKEVRADDKLSRKTMFYEEHGLACVILTREHWEADLYVAILGA